MAPVPKCKRSHDYLVPCTPKDSSAAEISRDLADSHYTRSTEDGNKPFGVYGITQYGCTVILALSIHQPISVLGTPAGVVPRLVLSSLSEILKIPF